MNSTFQLSHDKLAADAAFAGLDEELDALSPIDSEEAFNQYCREACRLWREHFRDPVGQTSSRFGDLLERIERRSEGVIKTSWGGVVITLHQPPRVEKFLTLRRGGYLALEVHEEKDERLEVQEGAGLILWRTATKPILTVEPLRRGAAFHLVPGMEHCLIGTEDLLIFERSIDPKGMDQDLIFIYEPDGR